MKIKEYLIQMSYTQDVMFADRYHWRSNNDICFDIIRSKLFSQFGADNRSLYKSSIL